MDWNDPAQRLALIESVGVDEYNRAMAQHHRDSIVVTVAGHDIRTVGSRFGTLFMVGSLNIGFQELNLAVKHAIAYPAEPVTALDAATTLGHGNANSCTMLMTFEITGRPYDFRICGFGKDAYFEVITEDGDPVGDAQDTHSGDIKATTLEHLFPNRL